jgi:hypothetical protein
MGANARQEADDVVDHLQVEDRDDEVIPTPPREAEGLGVHAGIEYRRNALELETALG